MNMKNSLIAIAMLIAVAMSATAQNKYRATPEELDAHIDTLDARGFTAKQMIHNLHRNRKHIRHLPHYYVWLGVFHCMVYERANKGLRFAKRALKRDPHNPYAYCLRAEALLLRGEYEAAMDDVSYARFLHPELEWAETLQQSALLNDPK